MNEAARQEVRQHAGFRCEYCRIHERHLPFSAFHLVHVVARQHAGTDDTENVAWSCQECNLLKGTNLSAIDPDTGAVVRLFHPRTDQWDEHIAFMGNRVVGLTPHRPGNRFAAADEFARSARTPRHVASCWRPLNGIGARGWRPKR